MFLKHVAVQVADRLVVTLVPHHHEPGRLPIHGITGSSKQLLALVWWPELFERGANLTGVLVSMTLINVRKLTDRPT